MARSGLVQRRGLIASSDPSEYQLRISGAGAESSYSFSKVVEADLRSDVGWAPDRGLSGAIDDETFLSRSEFEMLNREREP